MTMPAAEGGCLCTAVRYRIGGEPLYSVLCHCASCRRASGAPAVAWLTIKRVQLQLLSGDPASYRSSPGVLRTFCSACGSPISYETDTAPATIDLTTATLDDPTAFPPTREVWMRDKLWWMAVNKSLDHYPGDMAGGPYAGD